MDRIVLHVYYSGENGKAAAFAKEMISGGLQKMVYSEEGCLQYEYYTPLDDTDKILLLEAWRDEECIRRHQNSENMKKIKEMKAKFGLETVIERYE